MKITKDDFDAEIAIFSRFFIMLYKSGIYKNMHDNKISF